MTRETIHPLYQPYAVEPDNTFASFSVQAALIQIKIIQSVLEMTLINLRYNFLHQNKRKSYFEKKTCRFAATENQIWSYVNTNDVISQQILMKDLSVYQLFSVISFKLRS